jgi:hypothetical protein
MVRQRSWGKVIVVGVIVAGAGAYLAGSRARSSPRAASERPGDLAARNYGGPPRFVAAPPRMDDVAGSNAAPAAWVEAAKPSTGAMTDNLARLSEAARLTELQQKKTGKILEIFERSQAIVMRQSDPVTKEKQLSRLALQTERAVVAVVSRDQEPLVARYFAAQPVPGSR